MTIMLTIIVMPIIHIVYKEKNRFYLKNTMLKLSKAKTKMHNILHKNLILTRFCCNILVFSGYIYIVNIIENRDVLMTIM